ncbi:MAG: histidine kinase [Flavobacteriales bacterium]|nr:MAG: histidine kinase [Flavobacteriales bacterium]
MRSAAALSLLLAWSATAQRTPPRITFDLIGVNDGLPHAIVECFMVDKSGILWVGMQQGLAVYDGSAFTPVDLADDGAPISVRALTQDSEGIIWVAAEQGPVRVDPVTRRAELLPYPDSLKQGVETLWSHAVAATAPGEVLFGTHKGTFFIDDRTRAFKGLRHADGSHVRTYWKDFQEDSARNGVWISTHDRGLVFYDKRARRLLEQARDPSFSPLLGTNAVSLCPDGRGGLWCSDRTTGQLWNWDGHSKRIRTWDHVPGRPDVKVSRTWTLVRDGRGRIWGAASRSGAFMFDPNDSSAVIFPTNAPTGGLPRGSVNDLYESANGEIWIANYMGIAIHDPAQPQPRMFDLVDRKLSPSAPRIWAMEFAGDSALWCAMGEFGLVHVDLHGDEVRSVPLGDLGLKDSFVWDVLPHDGKLLVACASDLLELDVKKMKWRKIHVVDETGAPPLPDRRWLASGADGSIWMGLWPMRMVNVDPRTGRCTSHVPDSTREGALRYDNVYGAVSMKDGRTWVCGNLHGLAYHDAGTSEWVDLKADVTERRLRVGRVVGMTASSDSVLWLASDGAGLIRYDIPTGIYTHYDHRHGITELGLYSVVVDGRGRIWTDSDERIFSFNPVTEHAMVVDPNSSTGGDAAKWTLAISSTGLFAMNIGRELAVFDADAVVSERVPPAPLLTRILVDGTAVAVGAEGGIKVPHDHTQLEVRFGAMLPPGSIVAYAMRAPGEEWSAYNEGRVTLRGLQPGEHAFEFRLKSKEGSWGPAAKLLVKIPPPWWQTLWARILFAVLLATGIVLVFRARLNWVRKRERAQEEQERHVNELKLQALRAQMDPHFVFNCLNSIDSFIIANDREQASHYLGRFAKLIRLILQHSDSTRVPLEREVEMLRYYLELEALRFKYPFTFAVTIDDELEGEPVELPTMLVQPYIENAIWHGLRHKESSGHIAVDFKLHDDQLECTVEDNGIGRAASRAINQQRSGVHRSMGMRVSADRLRIYGELEQGASRVTITDLMDADGIAQGTRVVIMIPILAHSE